MSPILPFLTEEIWQNMVREIEPNEAASVHLSNFPKLENLGNEHLIDEIEKAREVIYLAQKLRNEHKIKVKQPLRTMFLIAEPDYKKATTNLAQIVKDELNIKNIEYVEKQNKFNDSKLVLNFKKAGAVLKGDVNKVKNLLEMASKDDMQKMVESYQNGEQVEVENFKLDAELLELKLTPKPEYAIAMLGNNLVALDIELDEELVAEGTLREIIRQIQVARKEADFLIEDRINIEFVVSDKNICDILEKYSEQIKKETLTIEIKKLDNAEFEKQIEAQDKTFAIKLERVK